MVYENSGKRCDGKSGAIGLLSSNANSLEECQSLCKRHCNYVSFNSNNQNCYGYNTCDSVEYRSYEVIYVKRMCRIILVF